MFIFGGSRVLRSDVVGETDLWVDPTFRSFTAIGWVRKESTDVLSFVDGDCNQSITLLGTNISQLGKRKICFKSALGKGYVTDLDYISYTFMCYTGSNCHRLSHWAGKVSQRKTANSKMKIMYRESFPQNLVPKKYSFPKLQIANTCWPVGILTAYPNHPAMFEAVFQVGLGQLWQICQAIRDVSAQMLERRIDASHSWHDTMPQLDTTLPTFMIHFSGKLFWLREWGMNAAWILLFIVHPPDPLMYRPVAASWNVVPGSV